MDNLELFKDFLGGEGFSAEYMRNALGVAQDDAEGMHYDDEFDALEPNEDDNLDDDDMDGAPDDDIDDDDMDGAPDDDIDDDDMDGAPDDDMDDDTDYDYIDDISDDDNISDGTSDDEDFDNNILSVSEEAINDLLARASGVERPEGGFASHIVSFAGAKICATRHGCKGATNCDYAYGAPAGR